MKSRIRARRREVMTAYILGSLGLAVAAGLATLMFMSPRTRTRALNAAKDTYGKVNEKISHLRPSLSQRGHVDEGQVANGLAGQGTDYSTTSV